MTQPTLYILMRSDMDSLNPGKAMAQAAHASNAFTYQYASALGREDWFGETYEGPDKWEPQGFGTTIVLEVKSERELREAVTAASYDGFPANIVLDHTYPVKDGYVTHLLPVVTCGYVFTNCRREHPVAALADMNLHP